MKHLAVRWSGFCLGFIITSWIVLSRWTHNVQEEGRGNGGRGNEGRDNDRVNSQFPYDHDRPRLLHIGVLTSTLHLHTRARSLYRTWGKEMWDIGTLQFYSGGEQTGIEQPLPIVHLKGKSS